MRVYFGCSIAGGRDHVHVYQDVVKFIKATGANLSSEIFVDKNITADSGTNPELAPSQIWKRDTKWIKEADALIMEVTQPSLGVGYEIALAEKLNKPILALFNKASGRRLSPMIAGNSSVKVFQYTNIQQAQPVISKFIKSF